MEQVPSNAANYEGLYRVVYALNGVDFHLPSFSDTVLFYNKPRFVDARFSTPRKTRVNLGFPSASDMVEFGLAAAAPSTMAGGSRTELRAFLAEPDCLGNQDVDCVMRASRAAQCWASDSGQYSTCSGRAADLRIRLVPGECTSADCSCAPGRGVRELQLQYVGPQVTCVVGFLSVHVSRVTYRQTIS